MSVYSCNSGNKVVSAFGKRKYSKGYFFNRPTETRTIIANGNKKTIVKPLYPKQINIDNKLSSPSPVSIMLTKTCISKETKHLDIPQVQSIVQPENEQASPAIDEQAEMKKYVHNNGRPALIVAGILAIAAAVGYATAAATITPIGTVALIVFLVALVASIILAIPTFFTNDKHPREGLIAAIIDIIAIGLLLVGNLFNE